MSPSTNSDSSRLFLIRHGTVAGLWRRRIYGDLDVPLSDQGRAEARRCAEGLAETSLAAVVSSGLARAEYGAALLRAGRGLPRRDEPDLREIDRGAWRGRPYDSAEAGAVADWERWLADPETLRPPGGESLGDLRDRVLPALDRLAQECEGRAAAVVTHAWVVRVAVLSALGAPLARAPLFEVRPGSLVALDWPARFDSGLRPTLAGFQLDRPPAPGTTWFRGPSRDPAPGSRG